MVLDFVFTDLDTVLKDGETVAKAYQTPTLFGRRIDLVPTFKRRKFGLACNAWKSLKTKHMYMRQQSKNLRSNCLILNTLFVRLGGKVNQVVAVNSLGKPCVVEDHISPILR